jgi:hypothetical protein
MADAKICDNCGTSVQEDEAEKCWISTRSLSFNHWAKVFAGEFCSLGCVADYFGRLAGLPAREGAATRRLSISMLDRFLGRVPHE